MENLSIFEPWIDRWSLTPDGEPFETRYAKSWLIPVCRGDQAAMLKIATAEEEIRGAALMAWWAGDGAPRVLARKGPALLLERISGKRSLADMARVGDDDEATRILCTVADRVHAPRAVAPPDGLYPLAEWFKALAPAAAACGGVLATSLAAATRLLAEPRDVAVLHGDLHHENVLDGGARGWLVIDPKGVFGERGYDYASMLMNPDAEVAFRTGRIARQIHVAAKAARLEPRRLTLWLLAHAGLSAAWCMQDGFDPEPALEIAAVAEALL